MRGNEQNYWILGFLLLIIVFSGVLSKFIWDQIKKKLNKQYFKNQKADAKNKNYQRDECPVCLLKINDHVSFNCGHFYCGIIFFFFLFLRNIHVVDLKY